MRPALTWKGKYGATLITSWYSGKRWDVSHTERAGLASGSVRFVRHELKEQLEIGGGSLQVKIALFPASFSYPGIVTVNTCLLTFLAIAPICVTECCPQSHRTGGEVGEFARGCPRSCQRGFANAGVGMGSVSTLLL